MTRDEACIDFFRAAAASVLAIARDEGLTDEQYKELDEWLTAMTKLIHKYATDSRA